jgi:microcin C transport system substrate-binding protein
VVITRRLFFGIAGAAFLAPIPTIFESRRSVPSTGFHTEKWQHGLSLFGGLNYPAGFAHFDYVNPYAAKGGRVRQAAFGTYDNFNMVVAGWKGQLAIGLDLIYETLLTPSMDEISAEYGLLAEAVAHPADFSSVTYRLRSQAKWHDRRPVTPDDVIFSFDAFKKNNPQLSAYYRRVIKAEATGEREITFAFDSAGNRELPQIIGQLTILPKHWWEAKGPHKREIAATTLEPPLGSGPYRIKEFEPGRTITYERVENYWGKDLNVRIGRDNFGELRFDYFRDYAVEFEAFKADQFDWYDEHSAKNWAPDMAFPQSRKSASFLRSSRSAISGSCRPSRSISAAPSSKIGTFAARSILLSTLNASTRKSSMVSTSVSPVILKEPSLRLPAFREVENLKCSNRRGGRCRRKC